jgi:ferredoxin
MAYTGLPDQGPDGRARASALAVLNLSDMAPTSIVEFVSHGRCLVIGDENECLKFVRELTGMLECVIAVPSDAEPRAGRLDDTRLVRGGRPLIRGALGNFEVMLFAAGGTQSLGGLLSPPIERFDLVVDLCTPRLLHQAMLPLGYYAPGADEAARAALLTTLPDMCGEFEKPKYLNYNPEICAHGRNGKRGCTLCLNVCPAEAIVSLGGTVQVNPYYAYPTAAGLLGALRVLLANFQAAGGSAACLLFHDAGATAALEQDLGGGMAERLLPVEIEEIGSVGMEAWLACLAYGASAIVVLTTDSTPPPVVEALQAQLVTARVILAGMGYDEGCLRIVNADQPDSALQALAQLPGASARPAARFAAPPADKRGTLRLALQHLHAHAPAAQHDVALPPGAPFGEVLVNKATCTLCMSCVSACPTHALQDGRGLPQLHFREWNCVQCGLCERTCPEDAISLVPRFLYDQEVRERPRILHEEQPVCCLGCGKPFATRSMLDKLARKLEGHWMFQTDEARKRLNMCEDCRVRDLLAADARRAR